MKNTVKIVALLMIATCTFANDNSLINQLHLKYKHINHYQASFVQLKNVSYISKPLETKGQLEFALDLGLIWEVTHPLWVKTLITAKGEIYKSTKYQNKQKVKDLQIKLIAEIMTELLTANLDKIESHFETETFDQHGTWQFNLTPKKRMMKKALKQIQLKGIRENQRLSDVLEISIIDHADNITRISLSDIRTSQHHLDQKTRDKFVP